MALSIYWEDTVMGIISAVTGVACVVCTGKGKLSAYIFGTVNVVLYAIISYQAKYYGEVMLNALYYFPMEFYGFYVWNKHMNSDTHEVEKKQMNTKGRIIMAAAVVFGTVGYGYFLRRLGGALPFVDALSTVVSVVAMIVSVKMYMEQWILWIVVDVVTVAMWGIAFANGNDSIATLLMWIVYLGNAVIMYIKWAKEAKQNAV
ncbi:MAG TPA: nicotinamide mononucleotide transporter [Ruminococcaceae bacterium]|nr:nicotinamide mononucleotide transporter [Oscillospiraceae bacterium]